MKMAVLDMDIIGALVDDNVGRGAHQPIWARPRR